MARRSTPSHSTAFQVIVPLVLLAGLGLSLWLAVIDSSGTSEAADVARSPVEARQREILEQAIGRPGDPGLIRRYRDINSRHFDGRLPSMPVDWEARLAEVGALAAQAFTLEGMFGHIGDRAIILLHPNLQADEAALTRALCHEMVHAHLYALGVRTTDHGPEFRAELKRLSVEGAFTGIVASEAERASLRAWLDREAARLDAGGAAARREQDELAREGAALERDLAALRARFHAGDAAADAPGRDDLRVRLDAYNRRVADAAARAASGREDLAEFDRQVERYNLMLSYPDGFDERNRSE